MKKYDRIRRMLKEYWFLKDLYSKIGQEKKKRSDIIKIPELFIHCTDRESRINDLIDRCIKKDYIDRIPVRPNFHDPLEVKINIYGREFITPIGLARTFLKENGIFYTFLMGMGGGVAIKWLFHVIIKLHG